MSSNLCAWISATFLFIVASAQPGLAGKRQITDLFFTLDCGEVVHAEATEQSTSHASKRSDFSLTFARKGASGTMVGNQGAGGVTAIDGIKTVTLIEQTPWGTINTTSILKRAIGGVYKVVHSRHTVADGNFTVSQ